MGTCFACGEPNTNLPGQMPRGELNAGKLICRECAEVQAGLYKLPPLGKGAVTKILQGEDE